MSPIPSPISAHERMQADRKQIGLVRESQLFLKKKGEPDLRPSFLPILRLYRKQTKTPDTVMVLAKKRLDHNSS